MVNIMSYPLAHKIIKPFAYTNAANTDIRKTFQLARENAANQANPVLDADPVPTGTAQREKSDASSW
jgi:hypothetical protein